MPSRSRLIGAALVCLLWLAGLIPAVAQAGPRAADLVSADLIAEPASARAGEPVWVGVRLRMRPGWHTYWLNPGDTGLPTELSWTLPDGLRAGPILWPAPERIPVGPLVNYGYEGEAVLLTPITPPPGASISRGTELSARVSYLVCARECIPGEAVVSTRIGGVPEADTAAAFATARARLPVESPLPVQVAAAGDTLALRLAVPGLRAGSVKAAYFFPFAEGAIRHAAVQTVTVDVDGLRLDIARGEDRNASPGDLAGVLRLDEDLDGTLSRQALQIGMPPIVRPAVTSAPAGLAWAGLNAVLLAFLGGLILNLMPCVFPVLSIKALGLVRQAGGDPRTIRRHGVAYAAGVVATFVGLAALLLVLRAAGQEIGWGFQLQSPLVVAGLAALLFAMGLNLSGLASLGAGLGGVGAGVSARTDLWGSFATGALATIVATPCTAPFMGTALGFAVTAPAALAMAVFVALGLGMAAPFLGLALWPGLIGRLPRPGAWMEVLKQALAFPLYATAAWLVFVLAQQVGPAGLFAALAGLVSVAFGLWALGLAAPREGPARRVAQAVALAAAAGVGLAGFTIARDAALPDKTGGPMTARAGVTTEAEPFSQARLDGLRAARRPVFVNLTAAWCVTCLVNERAVLASERVRDAMALAGIVYLKGDWTRQNPEITRLLDRNGRSGVPLYLFYAPGREAETLPQILTQAGLLERFAAL